MPKVQTHKALFEVSEITAETFRIIYDKYWLVILKYANSLLHDEMASKDVVQVIFVSLWERREELTIQHAEAYLKKAVKYAVLHEIRKNLKNAGKIDELPDFFVPLAECSDSAVLYKDLKSRLRTFSSGLSSTGQKILQLKFEDDLDNRAIAESLNMSEKTVRNQLSLGLNTIRKKLKKSGYHVG